MRYDPLAMTVAASSSLLLILVSVAGEVDAAAAFAFGPSGGSSTCGGGCGSSLSVSPRRLGWRRPHHDGYGLRSSSSWQPTRFSCNPLLFATASDDDDSPAGPRGRGRPKVTDEELEERKEQLRGLLCATGAEIDRLVHQNPSILSRRDVVLAHRPKVALLQERLVISQKAAGKLYLANNNRLLTKSLESLEVNLDRLQEKLNLTEVELSKVIKRTPTVLAVPENTFLEAQQWISERLHLSDARIVQIFKNMPEVLAAKVSTLEEKVDWVQAAMSLSDEELSKLFGQFPTLFFYDPDKNVQPKLRVLQKTFDLSDQELKNLVTKYPSLFSMSVKNIEEKLQFYSQLVGESEAKRLVTKSPNLLNISLKKCLRPRLAEVKKAGEKVVWTEQLIQRLARRTPGQWEKVWIGRSSETKEAPQ